MITSTRRRGRRSLAAILAAMLMASVLAVVAGSPAHAANTSGEALVDTNDDGVGDAREFGGRDRYDTALRLADNFGEAKGLGGVSTAFVASGHTLVDAVSVSGLAGFLDAPVLLTPTDSLHGRVADFIENYGVDTIYVLGGSAAIADSVLEDMEALANEPTVTRIEGADRYATAAAVAAKLGGGAAWCGGEDPAAILVNGGDVSLAEAMMVGPIAHRLQLPVLLTAADELPSATTDFIEAEDIEHVVIVGGTDSVSEDVENAVSDAGVDTVARIAGDTAAATSVELAGLLTGDCKDDLAPVSGDTVALVHRDALPDGVAAAPVLSSTYDGGYLVPILVVGDTLPASVRDYLAATPQATDAGKLNLSIVAIGGTAAVSSSVMDAALAASASADDLTVVIGGGGKSTGGTDGNPIPALDTNKNGKTDAGDTPQKGDDRITLYFSDVVIQDSTVEDGPTPLTNIVRDILEINGAPARLENIGYAPGARAACDAGTVTVTLSSALRPGDTISVVSGAKLGASKDQRTVAATSFTVAAPAPDRSRPSASVVLIAGQGVGYVSLTDNGAPHAGPLLPEHVTVRLGTTAAQPLASAGGQITDGHIALAPDAEFAVGDRVTIAAGALVDGAKNKSLQRSFTAIRAQASPRITSVSMSNPNYSANAAVAVPNEITSGDETRPFNEDGSRNTGDTAPDIWIQAKGDGAAAGAAGNDWSISFDRASSYDATKDLDIDVRVNRRDRTVFIRFNNGKATFADLKAELDGNSAFAAVFEATIDPTTASLDAGACGKAANTSPLAIMRGDGDVGESGQGVERGSTSTRLADGQTKVAIEVRFNAYIETVGATGGQHVELLADILAARATAVKGMGTAADGVAEAPADETDADALTRVRAKLGLTTLTAPDPADPDAAYNFRFSAPGTTVRYEAVTSDASVLPQVRDLVTTAAAADAVVEDQTAVPPVVAKDPVAPVALGYAGDNPDTSPAKEDMNTSSQARIGRSSSVSAPK